MVWVLIVLYLWTELKELDKLGNLKVLGSLAKWGKGNLYKLSTESNEADTVWEFFETKSMNELNFDKIKALLGTIVADVGEKRTRLLLEHKEGMLTIGDGIVGVR